MDQYGKQSPPISRDKRLRYLPFDEIEVGMTIGQPVNITDRSILRLHLPAGHVLTEGNLRQLYANGAEFVCIALPETRSDEEIAADAAASAGRTLRIFEHADLSEPTMAALFDRVLGYRSK